MTTDDDSNFDHDDPALSDERQRAVDELGHRAGAALRRPAPPGGLAAITHHARNQRLLRGGVAVAAVAALAIVGVVVLGGNDHDQNRVISTDTVPPTPSTAPESTTATTVAPTTTPPPTSTALDVGSDATAGTAAAFPSCTAALDLPTTDGSAPAVRCWEIPEPGSIDMVFHPGACCRWLLLSHGGTQVEAIGDSTPADWPSEFGPQGSIMPTDEVGTPLTLATIDTDTLAALGVSTTGQLVWLDPWTLTAGPIPHPGIVSDVALAVDLPHSPPGEGGDLEVDADFWAVGIDGDTPVLWYDTGLGSVGWQDAALSGQSVATVAVVGEPGATGPALVAADQNHAYALLPEPDGTSRLWIASTPETGEPPQRTDLVFREPTGITVSFLTLWVSDGDGLHTVGLWPAPDHRQTVSTTPVRLLREDPLGSVVVLDSDGRVLRATDDGTLDEVWSDPELTDVYVFDNDPAEPYLFVSHGASDQFIIIDPTGALLGEWVECPNGTGYRVLASSESPCGPPGIELVSCDARGEVVTIVNAGATTASLSGYRLHNEGFFGPGVGGVLLLDQFGSLAPGETLRILSGPDAVAGPGQVVWTTASMWNDAGDTAFLVAPGGSGTAPSTPC